MARATGTSETNIADYERGDKTLNEATLARIAAAVDAGSTSPVFAYNLLTVPSAAAAIREPSGSWEPTQRSTPTRSPIRQRR